MRSPDLGHTPPPGTTPPREAAGEQTVHEGFFLPQKLRERLLAGVDYEVARVGGGTLWGNGSDGTTTEPAVTVRWPRLSPGLWNDVLAGLERQRTLQAGDILSRWQAALEAVIPTLMADATTALPSLCSCTGYSAEMITAALAGGDLVEPEGLSAAMKWRPPLAATRRWLPVANLPGRTRFYPHGAAQTARTAALARIRPTAPLHRPAPPTDLALGFAAGNVPGTALIIALLASLANCAHPALAAPAVLIRNSRHEPLFAPWVLRAVEHVDPELVAGIALLIWDYDDFALQERLLRNAGLLLAAAGDDTIAALNLVRARCNPTLRFHAHGHKVSFAALTYLSPSGPTAPPSGTDRGRAEAGDFDAGAGPDLPGLAALDSALWDQNGCLSARVHFVEGDADEYAHELADRMRVMASMLPRGSTPLRFTHRAFDAFAALEHSGRVTLLSSYDDPFGAFVDRRTWDPIVFRNVVNACQGRVVVVRPVNDLESEVPATLAMLPASHLQSLSVALDQARLPLLADGVGTCGVTAIRALGRAAFPRLAYSWDGYLPSDLGYLRPPGHFTTIEFDDLKTELGG